jgi:hypothetical protein
MEHVVIQAGCHVAAASRLKPALWMWNLAMIVGHQIAFAIQHFLAKRARIGVTLYVLLQLFLPLGLSIQQKHAQKTWTFLNVLEIAHGVPFHLQ